MARTRDLRVFISWSGPLSRAVATELYRWIPNLFDTVELFMSDEGIEAGQRPMNRIEEELAGTGFGIIVVTRDNQHAPWLNFEAGALSKQITEDREQRVVPLLVDVDSPTQISGPLVQFQAKLLNEYGMKATMRSIGSIVGVREETVDRRVSQYWPELEEDIAMRRKELAATVSTQRRSPEDMLEEVLGLLRAMRSNAGNERVLMERSIAAGQAEVAASSVQTGRARNRIQETAARHNLEIVIADQFISQGRLGITVEVRTSADPREVDAFGRELSEILGMVVRIITLDGNVGEWPAH